MEIIDSIVSVSGRTTIWYTVVTNGALTLNPGIPCVSWKIDISNGVQGHSVLEWIWVKGSYLSQWLTQGERGPPKESKLPWIEISHVGSH